MSLQTGEHGKATRSSGRSAGGRLATGGALLLMLLALAGCKVDLYSNLTEAEANEMLAVLMSSGIPAVKGKVADTFVVRVGEDEMVRAISMLTSKGYPKTSRQSIGSVFQKSGLISSPFEERVRYIYALGEEIAQTLSQIDGVVSSRVHIVIPEEPALGQEIKPSSAAVFIKHEPNVDLEFFVPQIRRLVSSSIKGLDYADVTVVLAEAMVSEMVLQPPTERLVSVLPGLQVREADASFFWALTSGAAMALFFAIIGSAYGLFAWVTHRKAGKKRPGSASEHGGSTALEPS